MEKSHFLGDWWFFMWFLVILLVGTGEPPPYCNKNTLGKIGSKFGIGRPPPLSWEKRPNFSNEPIWRLPLALYLSDNPQPILPQYQPMQVANVFNVFLHLTLALAGIGIGYGLAVDWRIGRWLTVLSVPVVDKWQGYGIVSVILASDWCICLVLVNCCHARLIDILSCHRIVEEIGILLI